MRRRHGLQAHCAPRRGWLFPVSIWHNFPTRFNHTGREESSIYTSNDGGETLTYLGGVQVPTSTFDVNYICERADGSLLMLIRTQNGINYTESFDGRRTWTTPADYWIPSPSALMYLGKFPSGNFFLIHHYQFEKRDHMSVLLSHDEGRSYDHVLLLDERFPVAYPVVFLDGDKVYAVYDRARYGYKEIHMAVFREENVLAGRCVTEGAGLKRVGPRQAVHSALRKSGRIVSGRGNTAHQWIPAAMGLHRKRAIFQIRKRRRIYRIPSNTRWPRCFAALCFSRSLCAAI